MRFINTSILYDPLNWLVIGVVGAIWLLAIHVVVGGWTRMSPASDGAPSSAPGTVPAVPVGGAGPVGAWPESDPAMIWTDGYEARFVGDGWLANG